MQCYNGLHDICALHVKTTLTRAHTLTRHIARKCRARKCRVTVTMVALVCQNKNETFYSMYLSYSLDEKVLCNDLCEHPINSIYLLYEEIVWYLFLSAKSKRATNKILKIFMM